MNVMFEARKIVENIINAKKRQCPSFNKKKSLKKFGIKSLS